MLLEQRDQEVDRQVNVLSQVVGRHVDVSDGHAEAKNLLHLELDGRLDLLDLAQHRFRVGQRTRELTGLVEARAEKTRDLLDQRLAGQESIVFLG